MKIAIGLPAFNEEKNIDKTITKLLEKLRKYVEKI